ncbi:MAG: type II toxin-antitoxin system HicA family toxin [Bacillota bacterium]
MTRFDKLYTKIANNPIDVKFSDLDNILKQYGFECRQPNKGSSHYIYYHQELSEILTIPYARPIKAIYVKQAIKAIEKLKEGSE